MVQQKDYSDVIKKIDLVAEKIYNDFQKSKIPSLESTNTYKIKH